MGKHISKIKTQEVIDLVGNDVYDDVRKNNNEINTNVICLSVEYHKSIYQQYAGWQDYKPYK